MSRERIAPRWVPDLLIAATLVTVTSLVYLPVAGFSFVNLDDGLYVSFNPLVRSGLSLTAIRQAFTTVVAGNWHPLTIISHQLDVSLFNVAPGPHHLHNLLLHLGNTVLLFFLCHRLTGARWRSAFVAAVFALHPLHVESVAWVSERKDLLSTLFGLAALSAYAAYTRRPCWRRLAAAIVLTVLGLLAKPMLVTLPLLMLLLDWWPLGRSSAKKTGSAARVWGALVAEKTPILALSTVFSVIALLAQSHSHSVQSLAKYSPVVRLGNAAIAAATYLEQAVWPAGLAVFYPHPGPRLPAAEVALSVAILAGICAIAFHLRRTYPFIAFGWLWYLLMLLPVLGLVQLGELAHADRYTYLPLTGILMSAAWWADTVAHGRPRAKVLFGVVAFGIIATLAIACRFQVRFWKNDESLFTRALAVTRDNVVAHYNLGLVRAAQGRRAEAAWHSREAIRLEPYNPQAYFVLGNLAFDDGDFAEAALRFRTAAELDPQAVEPTYNLAVSLERLGRFVDAASAFRDVLRLEPGNLEALLGRGRVLLSAGRSQDALEQFRAALRMYPGSTEAGSWVRRLEQSAGAAGHGNPPPTPRP